MARVIKLSAIVTVHDEGIVAHKTMLSVLKATKKVGEAGFEYEIVVHIDRGDEATRSYFERYKKNKLIRIIEGNYGDIGESRNHAVEESLGEYVAFLDGDDLVSQNWYIEAIKLLEKNGDEVIVCPGAVLTFGIGEINVLTLQSNSQSKEIDTLVLLGENAWSSVVMARREVFEKTPYKKLCNADGYSHEDYLFNTEIIEKGIRFMVAPGTVLFYRRTFDSRLSNSNASSSIIPYTKLFDFNYVKNIRCINKEDKKTKLRKNGRMFYKKLRNNQVMNVVIKPFAVMGERILNHKQEVKVPSFIVDAWLDMNKIETQLYPGKKVLKSIVEYSAKNYSLVGDAYYEIAQGINNKPDFVFIVPWLVRGGADKVLLNYIKAIKEIDNKKKIAVIATLPAKHSWRDRLPEDVDFIDFGNVSLSLSPEEQDILFSKIIMQLQCKRIHVINSEYMYLWLYRHYNLIKKQKFNLSVSLFAYEYISGSNMRAVFSYDDPYILNIYELVKNIFTDNENVIDYSVAKNSFGREKFKVHYQPVFDEMKETKNIKKDGPWQILWAGRVVDLKLPNVVAEIGRRLDPSKFIINVYGEIGDDVKRNVFADSPAIKYHGAFDGFGSLPVEKMDLFLYTSINDGIPNTILEAVAAGLPVIASNDGGVSEVIKDGVSGVLVNDIFGVDDYIEAIKAAVKEPEKMMRYAEKAQEIAKKRHSWENFKRTVKSDFNI